MSTKEVEILREDVKRLNGVFITLHTALRIAALDHIKEYGHPSACPVDTHPLDFVTQLRIDEAIIISDHIERVSNGQDPQKIEDTLAKARLRELVVALASSPKGFRKKHG